MLLVFLTFDLCLVQVNWFATVCLITVIIAVVSIYAGAFNPTERVKYIFPPLSCEVCKLSSMIDYYYSVCTIDGAVLRGPLSCDPGLISQAEKLLENGSMLLREVSLTASTLVYSDIIIVI